jgi:formate-dependent nitrite reductase membrane component NrfD
MDTMTFATQELWTWWFAIYLFLGGMGAAAITTSFIIHRYLGPQKSLAIWGGVSGVVMLALGSGMLFLHLLDKWAAIYILTPWGVVMKPDAWIAWGSQFIVWIQITAALYVLPFMQESPWLSRLPVIGALLGMKPMAALGRFCLRFHGFLGWFAIITGVGTVVYTGLLLQSFPAVALWNNPGVPVLFTVSAFSTAMAWLLLVSHLVLSDEVAPAIPHLIERIDLGLIVAELVIIFAFFNYTLTGSESARHSAELLWSSPGWIVGFIIAGLIVPLFLEAKSVFGSWKGKAPVVVASLLVLNGGYLLRHFFMAAGVYAYPW